MYMLDTNICSYILKNHPESVAKKFESVSPENLCISIITFAELYYGIEKSSSKKINGQIIDSFVALVNVFPWEQNAAKSYAKIRNELRKKGEIFDGDAPFTPRGCIAQAWTVAELLRVWQLIYTD